MKLEPSATAAGVRVIAHELVGSTNAEALSLARRGERGPFWVRADRQTAGRGRRGRSWISQPGNLYATLLLTEPAPAVHWPELSFVAALAVHDAVGGFAAHIEPMLTIKWPNDLLLGGKKFAGILIEGESANAAAVAIGIGVNCANHPAETSYPATDLAAAGAAVSPSALLRSLAATMRSRLAQWNRGEGFPTIRADWLARATGLGDDVCVRLTDGDVNGRFEAIDETGGLVLRLSDGSARAIAAGDVVMSMAPAPDQTD